MKESARLALIAMGAALLALSSPVLAVDGVVEINQAGVAAGGITPGDAPGFPATIDRSGSYRLTSNLQAPPGAHGVLIDGDGVTLDLNGFTISGPARIICPIGGCPPNNGIGVYAPDPTENTTVRNGTVATMGSNGIWVAGASRVEGVTSRSNGGTGIFAGPASIVSGNVVHQNGGYGLFVGTRAAVIGNSIHSNELEAILFGSNNGVTGGYVHNTISDNNKSDDPADQVANGVQMGLNMCQTTTCP